MAERQALDRYPVRCPECGEQAGYPTRARHGEGTIIRIQLSCRLCSKRWTVSKDIENAAVS